MKIELAVARARAGSRHPKPFDEPCRNKTRRRLGMAAGLTQFGVNLLELGPGAWSSQCHWHAHEDEFVYVVRGPVVLVTDAGETVLDTGDCAGFKAGESDGHHLQNRGGATALILEVGTRGSGEPMPNSPISTFVWARQGMSTRTARHIHSLPPNQAACRGETGRRGRGGGTS